MNIEKLYMCPEGKEFYSQFATPEEAFIYVEYRKLCAVMASVPKLSARHGCVNR